MRKGVVILIFLLILTVTSPPTVTSPLSKISPVWAIEIPPSPIAPYGLFSTFSAETLKKNTSAYMLGLERSIEPDYYISRFALAYGITDKIEFGLSIPYVIEEATDGFGDASFGFKYRLIDEGRYGPSLTAMIYLSPPTGSNSLSADGRFGAGGFITKKIGPLTTHLNLIYTKPFSSSLKDEIVITGGFDFSASRNFAIIADLYSRSDSFDLIEGRFGYRLKTTEYIYTTIGIGMDLKNRRPEYRLFFSVSILPFKKERREEIEIIRESE